MFLLRSSERDESESDGRHMEVGRTYEFFSGWLRGARDSSF